MIDTMTLAAISAAMTGRKSSAETRSKMCAAQLKRRADERRAPQ